MLRKSYLSVLATAALIFLFSCSGGNDDGDQEPEFGSEPTVNIDLPEIMKRGKLTILAENSSTTYFIYKGKKWALNMSC
jgi:membrane-bound lytic murein transglycosylase F